MRDLTESILDGIETHLVNGATKALNENDEYAGFVDVLSTGRVHRRLIIFDDDKIYGYVFVNAYGADNGQFSVQFTDKTSTSGDDIVHAIDALNVASFNETYPKMLDDIEVYAHWAVVNYLKNN